MFFEVDKWFTGKFSWEASAARRCRPRQPVIDRGTKPRFRDWHGGDAGQAKLRALSIQPAQPREKPGGSFAEITPLRKLPNQPRAR
jgi:hypothetical protein